MGDRPAEYQDHLSRFAKGEVAAAQALLEEAGHRKGADGIYAKGGRRLSLRFSTTTGNALREAVGALFRDQMRQVGIEVKLRNTDSTTLFGT